MSAQQPPNEPSIEDRLASIRRMIDSETAAARKQPLPRTTEADDDDALLLTDQVEGQTDEPEAPLALVEEAEGPEPGGPLLGPAAASAATQSFSELADVLRERQRSLHADAEGPLSPAVLAALEPHLKAWLDQHLPGIVERVVRLEVRRLIRRAEDE